MTQTGTICIKLRKGERAIARPFVVVEKNKFRMWYCFEKKLENIKLVTQSHTMDKNGLER